MAMSKYEAFNLPGKNCGSCGYRYCDDLAVKLESEPELIKRCIFLSDDQAPAQEAVMVETAAAVQVNGGCAAAGTNGGCAGNIVEYSASNSGAANNGAVTAVNNDRTRPVIGASSRWNDSLGREFDFVLEHFPEEPGPREIIIPHNPMITREMEIQPGDILIGRPLGMSCGCPITHCGVVMDVDHRTGVMTWCVTGPLNPRQKGFKDLGYYIAEGYEGLIKEARTEIRIGMRYYFQPHMCMLQWRHSGLVNYMNRSAEGLQVRVEGLWIG